MATTEKALENRLIKICKKNSIKTIKGFGRGFPDRIIFVASLRQIHYVELKNSKYYTQTKLQQYWQKIIESAGGKYFLINGDDELNEYIKKYISTEA